MRLTTIAASAAALALTAGGAAVAVAEPGPNESNNFGLCTAYEARNSNGKDDKNQPKPFAALEAAAADSEGGSTFEKVMTWCSTNGTKPGNGGGKPDDGGTEG